MRVYLIIRAKVVPLRRILWAYPSKHAFLTIKIIHIMRKLFLLIPALALTLLANATSTTISPGTPKDNNIRAAINETADTVYLNPGEYIQENQIHLKRSVVLMAANMDDKPVIQLKYYCDLIGANSKVELNGLILDGTVSGQQAIRVYDNAAGKELRLKNCEFKNFAKATIANDNGAYPLDSCIINNCYFHDNKKSALYFVKSTVDGIQTCHGLIVKNSTFANYDVNESAEYYASVINLETYDYSNTVATDVDVLIDHCTFYNYLTYNTDHCAIRIRRADNVTVSNCIFAHPTEQDRRATYLYDDSNIVTNCLAYNLTKNADNYAHAWGPAVTNCVIANPLFNDLANNKYTYAGNWVTMELSPARGAATDGSDLGDPRWYSDEILPETDFASAYDLLGTKAVLSGRIELNANNHIKFKHNDNTADGTAKWKLHVSKACYVSVVADREEGSTSGCQLTLTVKDADGNTVGEPLNAPASYNDNDINFNGEFFFPEAGDYTLILTNSTLNSGAILEKLTLSYYGGSVQAMPGTATVADAWFSDNGTRADGKISFPGSTIQNGWVKWNVTFANTGNYNVTLNVNSGNCKNYTVALVDENDADLVTPLTLNDCSTTGTPVALNMGAMEVPAGNYILKVTNGTKDSDAELISVQFAPAGGAVQNIPGPIALNEAILSERAFIDGDGLHFVDAEHLWLMSEGYAKWNIHVAADGMYKFTANCNTDGESYSNLTIKVLKGGEEKYSFTPEYTYIGEKTINSPEWFLEAGNYELKLSNPANYSNGYLVSLSAAAVEGILIVDEMATDMQYITVLNGESRKPVLKRSFRANMYNTVVFPFNGVGDEELTSIFGAGYELLEMTSAVLDGNTLNLNFAAVNLSQNTYGRPYLIKPTQDVVNPVFSSKTIYASTSHLTVEGTNADFIGSYIKGEVPAGENNLFLGPDDLLYFSNSATPIKGMRAWFRVKGVPNAMQAIKHARIITKEEVITSVDLVKDANNGTLKTIENGQLIIIKNGVRYNVMGVKIQ